MMFLEDTLHIFLSYLIIAVILWVPPYMSWWNRLVGFLNRREIEGRRLYLVLLIILPPLILISIIITHLFQFVKDLDVSFWLFFVPAAFIIIPFMSAYLGMASFARSHGKTGLGDLGALLFYFGGFGAAGANIHDVLWCGRRTELYTVFWAGGDDLRPWVELFHAPSYDYRIFGFYMFIQVVIALVVAHIVYFRWLKVKGIRPDNAPLKWNWAGMALLAFAITLIDWPHVITPPILHTACISIAILIATILFYKAGLRLSESFSRKQDSA
jgi:hypothetical protein